MKRAGSERFGAAILFTCSLYQLVLASSAPDGQVTAGKTSDVKPTESRQTQSPKRFEVAIVRKGTPSGVGHGPTILPGGRFEMENSVVTEVISRAYGFGMRLLNAPAWTASERY